MFMNLKRAKLIASGMAGCFLLIHILMFAIFSLNGVTPMARFNIFSICFYVFMLFAVVKNWFRIYAVGTYLEVVAHMILAVLLTGWNSGFQITLIGMNVLAFYGEYTGRSLKLNQLRMLPLCIFGMVLYLASYVYLHFNPAPYSIPAKTEFFLSLLWGAIVFVISLFVLQLLVVVANSSEEKLAYQLSHDKLTGLPNRYYLADKLEILKKEKDDYWIAISDIDNFKKINDTNGHGCGDYVLKRIGDLLASKDVLCCRWGGEEFIFAGKPEQMEQNPYDFLNEIRKEVESQNFEYDGKKFCVTMTFGLSESPGDGNIDDAIRDADEKLYIGKQSGKNKVVRDRDIFGFGNLAYQDSLTRVKNKSAFDKMVESLNLDIQHHTAQFGIVVVKLQDVDSILREFGQEESNRYIVGACKLLCGVYVNSQVFRVEEDKFAVILTNRDYYDRQELFKTLKNRYKTAAENSNDAMHQYQSTCGMAIYNTTDNDVAEVFNRVELVG